MTHLECFECGATVEPRIDERNEILPVRGEDTEVLAKVAVCPKCGADMSVEELDDATLIAAFNIYRERHGLMSPDEMRELRGRYGLGVKPFALLLGWGEITLHRYESGSLQDAAHEATLRLAQDPGNIPTLLSANGHKLTARQRARLEVSLADIEAGTLVAEADEFRDAFVVREEPGSYADYHRVVRVRGTARYPVEQAIDSVTEAIHARMAELGLTRTDLAARLDVPPARITNLLRGRSDFALALLTEVAAALECDLVVTFVPGAADTSAIQGQPGDGPVKSSP
ncbi:MAG: helix-turn-helix domain-containing protein [Coriobacteriia bacterium]|nr:helix-turn-helix domain-containing protein [Coriobacteriia bacterium]